MFWPMVQEDDNWEWPKVGGQVAGVRLRVSGAERKKEILNSTDLVVQSPNKEQDTHKGKAHVLWLAELWQIGDRSRSPGFLGFLGSQTRDRLDNL